MLFFSVRLSQRKSGWAFFPPGGWIMHGQQKHESSSEGVRGAMTHRVSSYTSQRCSDWSCGEQNDWVTTYHKTTPNQFQIEHVVAPISVTHCSNMLHYCVALLPLNKMYRMARARWSPHLSLLYSDGINFRFSQELVELHRQLLNFSTRAQSEDNVHFLAAVRWCKCGISCATERSPVPFIHHVLFNNITFQSTINIRCIWQNIYLNRTEALKAFQLRNGTVWWDEPRRHSTACSLLKTTSKILRQKLLVSNLCSSVSGVHSVWTISQRRHVRSRKAKQALKTLNLAASH